jgi:hypothetical protein
MDGRERNVIPVDTMASRNASWDMAICPSARLSEERGTDPLACSMEVLVNVTGVTQLRMTLHPLVDVSSLVII